MLQFKIQVTNNTLLAGYKTGGQKFKEGKSITIKCTKTSIDLGIYQKINLKERKRRKNLRGLWSIFYSEL